MSAPVIPEAVLRELSDLWQSLGKQEADAGRPQVLRACTMTLIAATDDSDDPQKSGETLAELMRDHPCRAIVLHLQEGDAPMLDAGVRAQCWVPFGGRQQICCELIDIRFTQPRLAGVVSLLQGLTVADLPVVLWSSSRRLITNAVFGGLLPLASRILIDSKTAPEPDQAVRSIAALRTSGQQVADLAWTRLTPWRKMIADLFESQICHNQRDEIVRLTVLHRGAARPTTALYLGAWLAGGFGPAVQLHFASAPTESWGSFPQGSVHAVVFETPDSTIRLQVAGSTPDTRQIELQAGTLSNRMVLPLRSPADLLREELSVSTRDPHFERALKRANEIIENQKP